MSKQDIENEKRVAFADEKENITGEKYSLGHRIQTPIPLKKDEKSGSHEADALLEQIASLQIDSSKKSTPVRKPLRATQVFEGITLLPTSEKQHKMITRADSVTRTPVIKLRSRSIIKVIENDEADEPKIENQTNRRTTMVNLRNRTIQEIIESEDETDESMVSAVSSTTDSKRPDSRQSYYTKRNNEAVAEDVKTEQHPTKFVALAEQIARFHKETPDRFRTKPHHQWRPSMIKPRLLMPQAPRLSCLSRSRPSNFPTREEREQQEYEEMLKHQIKAKPVNEKILKNVSLGLKAPIEKRPKTCPQPFHLTEYHKPKPVETEPVFQFKAQPAPTRILQSPVGIPPKKIIPATTPKTPAIKMPVRVKAPSPRPRLNSGTSTDSLPRNTRVEPFSFEQRDLLMKARKDEHIKKIIEEEKKTFNSFKAHPIRKFSETPMKAKIEIKKTTTPMPFNLTQIKPKKEEIIPEPQFKANPAAVLKKRPFFPIHSSSKNVKVREFELKTITRAEDRKKFDEKMQQAEEEMKKKIEQAREEEEKRLQEEAKQLRKQAEFKANPIPRAKAFQIHASSASLTQPMSPCFRSGKQTK